MFYQNFLLILMVLFCCQGHAQELLVSKVERLDSDITARTTPFFDLNGDPCALVKVNLVMPNVEFEGNVIKDIQKKGQYWLYMVGGSRILTIYHSRLLPCKIDFKEYGINKLEEKCTYSVTLNVPSELYSSLLINENIEDPVKYDSEKEDLLADSIKVLMDKHRYDEAFVLAKRGVEEGSVISTHLLAVMYYNGYGTEKLDSLAHKYSGIAAENGYPASQRIYGLNFIHARGCSEDEEEGVRWLELAAQNNDADAQACLGEIYSEGWGCVNPDLTKSFKWTRNAAEQGNVISQEQMSFKYFDGIGVNKDYIKANEWLRRAIDNGSITACANLGISFRDGVGVPVDYHQAEKLFLQGAELGDSYAACLLGHLYTWFLRDGEESFKKALHWYEKASDMGSEKATELLLKEYLGNSILGVLKNGEKADFYRNRLNTLRTASDDLTK